MARRSACYLAEGWCQGILEGLCPLLLTGVSCQRSSVDVVRGRYAGTTGLKGRGRSKAFKRIRSLVSTERLVRPSKNFSPFLFPILHRNKYNHVKGLTHSPTRLPSIYLNLNPHSNPEKKTQAQTNIINIQNPPWLPDLLSPFAP
jgi:hypothetical protein